METNMTRVMRWFVRAVFLGCYAAFLWASIHHVAAFFDNYEANGSDTFGSYLLAGAIDITALVTTAGVMFFRKSMPLTAIIILWIFIALLALYSWLINWEYASHYQSTSFLLQATGQTTPVLDAHGNVHYIPVMALNTTLMLINPALASCFTIFALVYSIVGEFFGAKQPTAEELQEKLARLQSTASIQQQIKDLEEKSRGPSLIARGKRAALELKAAGKEILNSSSNEEESDEETEEKTDRDTDKMRALSPGQTKRITEPLSGGNQKKTKRKHEPTPEENIVLSHWEKASSWVLDGEPTVSLKVVADTTGIAMKTLRNRVRTKKITPTKNPEIVFKSSLAKWIVAEVIPARSSEKVPLKLLGNSEESTEETLIESPEMERANAL